MKSEKPSGFKFRIDDETHDPAVRDDFEGPKSRKKSGRGTPLAVILVLLLGAAAGWGYYDLRKGLTALRSMDVTQMQSDLNSRFSSLSLQTAKMEESIKNLQGSFKILEEQLEKKTSPLDEFFIVFEKRTSALKEDIGRTEKSIEALKLSSADKKTVSEAITGLENKIQPIDQHLKNMESEIKALDENLTQELAEVSGSFYKLQSEINQFEKIQKDLSALSASKLDKKGLDAELKNLEKRLSGELDKIRTEGDPGGETLENVERQIRTMESQIQELMKFKALSEIKKRLEPNESSTIAPPAGRNPPPEKPQIATPKTPNVPASPKPGRITEENL